MNRRGGTGAVAGGDARAERWRAVLTMGCGALAVVFVLAAGGGLPILAALAAALAVAAFGAAYLAAGWSAPGRVAPAAPPAEASAAARGVEPPGGSRATPGLELQILERHPDPILVISRAGRILTANAAARALLALDRDLVLLSSVLRDPDILEAVQDALAGAPARTAPYETLPPQQRFMRAFVAPIEPSEPGGEARCMLALHDETAIKRAERARADFLANASHELRTPLASLAGYIETLQGHAKDDPVAREKFLGIMAAQAERMRLLIADLLSLSRIEQNEHVPPTSLVDLVTLAGEVVDALGPMAQERGVVLEIAAPAGIGAAPAPVLGDRAELTQVVQNLVENALKYSGPESRVEVEVGAAGDIDAAAFPASPLGPGAARMSLVTPASGDVRYGFVRVRDHGVGIPREALPRLSERFFRVGGEAFAKEGTGLGLAIVKHIVNRHRGGLAVESGPGAGSLFSAYFPQAAEAARAPAPTPAMRGEPRSGRGGLS